MTHTILLCQPTKQNSSRVYYDYETLEDALNGVCKMYETVLKQEHPEAVDIQYDAADLLRFLGTLTDLSLMVFDQNTKLYRPYGIDWVKYNVYHHLKKHAS